MAKPLSQITFDFGFSDDDADKPVSPPKKQKPKKEKEQVVEIAKPIAQNAKSRRGRKSLKDKTAVDNVLNIPPDEELFEKQYYAIGHVAQMFGENQSLIRYWETEFDILDPRKNRKGDRFFRPVDIKNLVLIYDLLRRRKFTIEGAKEYLKKSKKAEAKFAAIQSLQNIKAFLLELKANL
ncbi:MAG: hypothetical protein BWZ05_00387 [Bacteroidetes bacterium ADurb.BinA245]|jgi:DNA-binding transcriptional MerR regulator|nr:MerR family transcriptional regulator [Chitinophagaceae bacterium]OPZ18985.1 MAG: hypothetical protein BWZ05_00387 [Bacteroidetes bacterium ADurb.BinA245]HMW65841.1 MerR family transcriptional regulator [Chitinophagaceae bacterium]HNA18425.1 MerR family transcriptional regulator [Chitinophagaceae bacterium]HNK60098.1 MerR family transcriptional regulator [Chitinophagaceae bacterium]